MNKLPEIKLPDNYNYIGVFLTYKCNMYCSYCINEHSKLERVKELSGTDWIRGLTRIVTRADLPLTIQGGEPTVHPEFPFIINGLQHEGLWLDLLSNGIFLVGKFMYEIDNQAFKRDAKYASIRFSYHENTNSAELLSNASVLQDSGYEVGIWGVEIPTDKMKAKLGIIKNMAKELKIDFRTKEYLGTWFGKLYGSYKYPNAVSSENKKTWNRKCKASELLINPAGDIFRCHRDLYANEYTVGNILNPELKIYNDFRPCMNYGDCNPCDIKLKFNRFQETGHCSVEIQEV